MSEIKKELIRMSKEAYEINDCESCMMFWDCHQNENKKDNTKYCPEIDEDRWKHPDQFKDQKEFNNKLLDLNGYEVPEDYKYDMED